ncbi:hypothetical protein NRB16_17135 [Pseudomonas sp. LJDD11]|uniref:hypothetical protein n=1 Tax=unclassified Pseudomonas TaxID=196821 RepID=UPI0004F8EE87|nr:MULTISPECIES: hypothetical protein [unclassified Pseudomonas]MCQ9425247.1 hypothetical protein [Pseudomonas sp. LJDD11]BAP41847.1 hypothetical protein PSCI_1145 [Pseudomonas sp. StFLB209]
MLRIRGSIGQWPVDLEIEMDEGDWARLFAGFGTAQPGNGQQAATSEDARPTATSQPLNQDDRLWQHAQQLLQQAGALSGPDLLGQLESLAGSAAAAKRLLVRLRHNAQVKVESGADAPLYSWVQ